MQSMAEYYLEQGKAEGIEQGKAEGIEQGKAEGIAAAYRQWQAWNARRMEAEAEGKHFDEPPPTLPQNGEPTA